jgi:peptidoglycan/LPS O-acetylase OafA/YrhL
MRCHVSNDGGPAPLTSRGTRIPELDALRGVAAMAVVLAHFVGGYDAAYGHDFHVPDFISLGGYGVHLFFIISGFVILMTIENKARPRDFVIARIGRLYPTYWTSVLFTSVVIAAGIIPDTTVTAKQLVANLTMFQRFMKVPDINGAYWTLAYELAFYFLMLMVMRARLTKRIEMVSAIWLCVTTIYALALRAGFVTFHARVQAALLVGYCHLFVAGMMFYRLRTAGQAWYRHALIAFAAVYELTFGNLVGFAIVTGFLATFYGTISGKLKVIAVRPLVFLGSVSYALYVIHQSAGTAMLLALRRRGLGSVPALAIAVPTFVAIAWAITAFIERPAYRWITGRRRQGQGQT